MRDIVFAEDSFAQLQEWQSRDKAKLKRVYELIKSIQRTPFEGIGKPEALRGELAGKWSRRIDEKNRLVYSVDDHSIHIYQLKGHC